MGSLLTLLKEANFPFQIVNAVNELLDLDNKTTHLTRIQELLAWDQETIMPKQGIENRSHQMQLLEGMIHETSTHPRVTELLHILGVTADNTMGSIELPQQVQLWLRAKYHQWYIASCIPPALLQEIAGLRIKAHHVWADARANNDVNLFLPYLERTIALQKDKADCIGYKESRYDALLNEYERNSTVATLTPMFSQLCTHLIPLYRRALEQSRSLQLPPISVSESEQLAFCKFMAHQIGYTEDIGRIDKSVHPFCTFVGAGDTRITARCIQTQVLSCIFSVLHEIGHAFYDLGISDIYRNTVCDDGASYGIHESQSRFLENVIGRSTFFWEYYYPHLQSLIPAFSNESFDDFVKRLNYVQPNLIRVESNELSYNLHIIIRFEIEKTLIEGDLQVKDLPEVWNEKYKSYLGIVSPTNTEGVLQDIHWSEGYFGYFPSYTLGNLYAATLYEMLQKELPSFTQYLKKGSFIEIKEWLGKKIHAHGASKLPSELLPLSQTSIINYLTNRYIS